LFDRFNVNQVSRKNNKEAGGKDKERKIMEQVTKRESEDLLD